MKNSIRNLVLGLGCLMGMATWYHLRQPSGGDATSQSSQEETRSVTNSEEAQSQSDKQDSVSSKTPSLEAHEKNSDTATSKSAEMSSTPLKPACYKMTYKRDKDRSPKKLEEYARLQNIITLQEAGIQPQSLCVRVNGTPVKFETAKNHENPAKLDVIVNGSAGPNAEISAHYCVGKVLCQETCKVPVDEFMAALGDAGQANLGGAEYTNWDKQAKKKGPSAHEKTLEKELNAFQNELTKALNQKGAISRAWLVKERAGACVMKAESGHAKTSNQSF